MHGADMALARALAMQEMQEVAADGIVVGLHLDAAAVMREMMPVKMAGGAETSHIAAPPAIARHRRAELRKQRISPEFQPGTLLRAMKSRKDRSGSAI